MLRNKVFPQTVSLQRIGISDTSQCLGTWLVSRIPPRYTRRALKNIGFVNFIFKGIRNPPVSNQVLVDFLNSV